MCIYRIRTETNSTTIRNLCIVVARRWRSSPDKTAAVLALLMTPTEPDLRRGCRRSRSHPSRWSARLISSLDQCADFSATTDTLSRCRSQAACFLSPTPFRPWLARGGRCSAAAIATMQARRPARGRSCRAQRWPFIWPNFGLAGRPNERCANLSTCPCRLASRIG